LFTSHTQNVLTFFSGLHSKVSKLNLSSLFISVLRVNGRMTKEMVMVCWIMHVAITMKVIGWTINRVWTSFHYLFLLQG